MQHSTARSWKRYRKEEKQLKPTNFPKDRLLQPYPRQEKHATINHRLSFARRISTEELK
jgi:hypothetical protein